MSDQDRLTPSERDLEQALRSLRPATARFDLAAQSAELLESRRRTVRIWKFAAAAVVACVAIGVALWSTTPRRHGDDELPPEGVAEASPVIEPPTELAYRHALMRSTADFDALLDQHAGITGHHDGDEARIGVVILWRTSLQLSSGAL
jgi:hypothetical protein